MNGMVHRHFEPGTIIQITNEDDPWYPALLIVDEVKSWGVQAYIVIPKTNDKSELPALAYKRLNSADFEMVGFAVVTTKQEVDTDSK